MKSAARFRWIKAAIKLVVSGTLRNDGEISADGVDGTDQGWGGGGGSGGSVIPPSALCGIPAVRIVPHCAQGNATRSPRIAGAIPPVGILKNSSRVSFTRSTTTSPVP